MSKTSNNAYLVCLQHYVCLHLYYSISFSTYKLILPVPTRQPLLIEPSNPLVHTQTHFGGRLKE